jgi:hypothetical protein
MHEIFIRKGQMVTLRQAYRYTGKNRKRKHQQDLPVEQETAFKRTFGAEREYNLTSPILRVGGCVSCAIYDALPIYGLLRCKVNFENVVRISP